MNNLEIVNNIGINTCNIIGKHSEGEFRHIVRTKAGYTTCVEARDFDNERMMKHPSTIISGYKSGALLTVEFKPKGAHTFLCVFARKGKKILRMDETIMRHLDVAVVNSAFLKTELYDLDQNRSVGAKTWADKVFVHNTVK